MLAYKRRRIDDSEFLGSLLEKCLVTPGVTESRKNTQLMYILETSACLAAQIAVHDNPRSI